MEMIYDNKKDEMNLPDNARHYGDDGGRLRIYIEDYAFSFAREMKVDADDFGAVGVLLGERIVKGEEVYVYVKGAAEVTNAAVFSDKVAFTQETWPYVKRMTAQYFAGLDIVGWYFVSDVFSEEGMSVLSEAHRESFPKENDLLLLVDRAGGREEFYTGSGDGLEKVSGFDVYYDHNDKMQAYLEVYAMTHEDSVLGRDAGIEQIDLSDRTSDRDVPKKQSGGRYREMTQRPAGDKSVSRSVRTHLSLIYGLSMLLIIVVLVIGVNAINNYDKRDIEAPSKAEEANSNLPSVSVESRPGGVTSAPDDKTEPETTEAPTEPATTEPPTTEPPTEPATTEPATTEPPTEAEYVIHTVQQGDSLYSLCIKYYGKYNEQNMNRIKTANNWGPNSVLLIGSQLKIPKQ